MDRATVGADEEAASEAVNDIKAAPHSFWDEDGRPQQSPGYQRKTCLLCVAEKVRGATPLTDVTFICGDDCQEQTCGRHGEFTVGNIYR